MVVKTELCAFSENRIYPGHGRRFVTKIGQLVILSSSKNNAMYHQRKKPAKLGWTIAWRRMHKKLNLETSTKKKSRKVVKAVRAPVGTTLEKLAAARKAAAPKPAAAGTVSQASVKEAKQKAKELAKARASGAPVKQHKSNRVVMKFN